MKRLIRRIIRNIVNWAYGEDIGWALIVLYQAKDNLAMIMFEDFMRRQIKGDSVKEEDLK